MSTRWIMGLAILFFFLSVLSSIIEGLYMTESTTVTLYSVMMHFKSINLANPFGAAYDIVVGVKLFLQAIWTMFIWDYSFLTGTWLIVRYFFVSISVSIFVFFMFEVYRTVKIGG